MLCYKNAKASFLIYFLNFLSNLNFLAYFVDFRRPDFEK